MSCCLLTMGYTEKQPSLKSLVDGHMAEVTWAQLVLGNAMVEAIASHCVLLMLFCSHPH